MLHEVRRQLKIVLPEQLTDNLPLVWEQMVLEATREGFKKKNNWQKANQSASKHETDLRKTVKEVLQDYPGIKGSVDVFHAFNPSAVLSLNFDDKWTFGVLDRSYNKLPTNELGILNNHYYQLFYRGINDNVPVYFPNGHVNHSEYLRLGYRDFGVQAEGLRKAFSWYKEWGKKALESLTDKKDIAQILYEKLTSDNLKNQMYLAENKITWLNYFMLKPVLIVGADVGRHEMGLRRLLMQRKRNYAQRGEDPGVYWITTEKHTRKNDLLEYVALGVTSLTYPGWSTFWNEVTLGNNT